MAKEMDFEEYIEQQIKDGYINERLEPLKCPMCESDNLRTNNEEFENGGIIEYDSECGDCGHKVGHWAYGSWDI
jgi:hypothetical protein